MYRTIFRLTPKEFNLQKNSLLTNTVTQLKYLLAIGGGV